MTHILPTKYETDNRGPVLALWHCMVYGSCVEILVNSSVKSIGKIRAGHGRTRFPPRN